jgi:hypothetical protein
VRALTFVFNILHFFLSLSAFSCFLSDKTLKRVDAKRHKTVNTMKNLFDFSWPVAQGGYQWMEVEGVWFLTSGVPVGESFLFRRSLPLTDESGLYHTFAHTAPDREQILNFANRYGSLGESEDIDLPSSFLGKGERLSVWVSAIFDMRRAVALWELLQQKDTKKLARLIRWKSNHPWYVWQEPEGGSLTERIEPPRHTPAWPKQFQAGDVFEPAMYYLQRLINRQLAERVSPRLLWEPGYHKRSLYFQPQNLLGALWLQFAHVVAGNLTYRQCAHFKKAFVLHPDSARTNRRHCSSSCRTMAWRARKKTAHAPVQARKQKTA